MDYDQRFWSSRPDETDFWQPYIDRLDSVETSRSLVETLRTRCALPSRFTLHEMGANLGRNLHYLAAAYPDARLSANDVNPHAPAKLRETWPGLDVAYSVMTSQDWLAGMAAQGKQVDVVLSAAHFIHIEDLTPFVRLLPRVVGRYLILRESAGLSRPGSSYYERWTAAREAEGLSRWFDHDLQERFASTSLALVHRAPQYVYEPLRQYDIFVFQQEEHS